MVPELARLEGKPIERANARDRAGVRFGQVLGPLLGGILIAWVGATNFLFIDSVTFLTSALLVWVPRDPPTPHIGVRSRPEGPRRCRGSSRVYPSARA
jgi:hypothetical protein